MAIAGLLVHTLKEKLGDVESRIASMSEMTSYGTHQEQFIVVVAEAPSEQLEQKVEHITELDGVLTVYTTFVTVEDESAEGA
jgi:nitrate reductase NapAB chaperone NapD